MATTMPSTGSTGAEDKQSRPIPEKKELQYPKLGSALNELATTPKDEAPSPQEAGEQASANNGRSIAVTIYVSHNIDGIKSFLEKNEADLRNSGPDYIEVYVPVSLLGELSEQDGVARVREIRGPMHP